MDSIKVFNQQQKYLKKIGFKSVLFGGTRKPKRHKQKPKKKVKNDYMTFLANQTKGKGYKFFLESEYWKRVRTMVLKRDNYKCTICKNGGELHVHHDTYKNHFQEHKHLGDLLTLCKNCHTDYHKNIAA